MIHGVRYVRQDIAYIRRKHNCPFCDTKLNIIKRSQVINSNSNEADKIPSILAKTVIGTNGVKFRSYKGVGNIKWIWRELECPKCNKSFTPNQMLEIENSPKELSKEIAASFNNAEELQDDQKIECEKPKAKRNWKVIALIAIPTVLIWAVVITAITLAISGASRYEDTNGPDNYELTKITKEDILSNKHSFSSLMSASSCSGGRSKFVGGKYSSCDYDNVSFTCGKCNGITVLQATKIHNDTLTLEIESIIEEGNAEIAIIVDGEYYCSVDVNTISKVKLSDISDKEVIVKLAGESAKLEVYVSRYY